MPLGVSLLHEDSLPRTEAQGLEGLSLGQVTQHPPAAGLGYSRSLLCPSPCKSIQRSINLVPGEVSDDLMSVGAVALLLYVEQEGPEEGLQ